MLHQALTIALMQCNVTVGGIAGNRDKLRALYDDAAAKGAHLAVFPELAIPGYPPEDLVLRASFQEAAMQAVETLAAATKGKEAAMLLGGLWRDGAGLRNSAFLLAGGKIQAIYHKQELPNYGVFDEKRLFAAGDEPGLMEWEGVRLGVFICEDMWSPARVEALAGEKPELLISINASPYETGKALRRRDLARSVTQRTGAPLIYLNMIGGQDELVFDGHSFVMNVDGQRPAMLESFGEDTALTQWEAAPTPITTLPLRGREANAQRSRVGVDGAAAWMCHHGHRFRPQGDEETVYRAMMLGLKDYVEKNGFPGVIISLSGGVDSALTAAVAADALGAKRVHTVMMPSPYTSRESLEDAAQCAAMLGVSYDVITITPGMEVMDGLLREVFAGTERDTTEENIQARLRANLLMAISNKRGLMVVTTGNKSEMSVGYATLYGDMCGGYSVLKDVYKTTVYKICRWRNAHRPGGGRGPEGAVMPERVITKPPSAELKPNQTDQDTLPPYDILDAILLELIEGQAGVEEVIAMGYDRATVERVNHMLYRAEYKRRQAPPGVKISAMSFGRDRRYPIVNKFRG